LYYYSKTYFLTIFILKLKENASTLTLSNVATIFPTELGKKPNNATEWNSELGIISNDSTTTPNDGKHSTSELIILPKQTITTPNESKTTLTVLPKESVSVAPNDEKNQVITLPIESTSVPNNSGDLFDQPIISPIESKTIPNDDYYFTKWVRNSTK
jgi:hypothetical protein